MRAPHWALALTAVATAGTGAFITLPAGSASAESSAPAETNFTYSLGAQGDAMYYLAKSQILPLASEFEGSSLVASAKLANGAGRAFASSPYYGTTVQNLPGTANGIPPSFGAPGVGLPFTRLPGYIECRTPDKAEDDGGLYRTKVNCGDTSVTAHGDQGAPASIPAPNQQETADAVVSVAKDVATAEAVGTAAGFVQGPLEVGYATAQAKIVDTTAKGVKPTFTGTSFGRFSVNGQDFGFNQNGFRYLGQESSSKDAVAQANTALKNAGIQLELVPLTNEVDPASGATKVSIGGLKVTTTQAVPGAEPLTITYILGRAEVSSLNDAIDFGTSAGVNSGAATGAVTDSSTDSSTTGSSTTAGTTATGLDAVGTAGAIGELPATTDTAVMGLAPALAVTGTDPVGTVLAGETLPQRLGFAPVAGQTGNDSEMLYAMLLLAGAAVLGGNFLFSRFAVARKDG